MPRRDRIVALLGLSILFSLACVVFYYTAVPTIREYLHRLSFDAAVWQDPAKEELRIRMVDNLLWRYRLVGMSRQEIEKLLGPSTKPAKRRHFPGHDYVYRLGREPFNSKWLLIKLDGERVIEASIEQLYRWSFDGELS